MHPWMTDTQQWQQWPAGENQTNNPYTSTTSTLRKPTLKNRLDFKAAPRENPPN